MRLIHVTDPHLSSLEQFSFSSVTGKRRSGYLSWYRKRRHVHRRDVLDQLTEAALAESPDQFLVTGDLVHIGLEEEMIQARDWLKMLGLPGQVTLVPGNHDVYAADSQAAMVRHWGDYLPEGENRNTDPTSGYPFIRDLGDIRLVGASTACVTRIFSATGALGTNQLSKLPEALSGVAQDAKPTCLLLHHPPLPGITQRRKALRDASSLQATLLEQQPELVLYGHLHRNREHRLGDSRIFGTASASAAQGASYRIFDVEKHGNGWRLRMRLKSIAGNGDTTFSVVSEQNWEI